MTSTFKTLRILTILLAISLAVVSIAGAFFSGTYERDAASMAAQGVGQDLVDLFLVVPMLIITFFYASKGKRVASLLYGGILFYIMYSFIIYCFGVHFNQFFLLYCLTLGISLFGFILFMISIQQQNVAGWFEKAPEKPVAGYIFFVALVFYALWLKSLIPAIFNNSIPAEVIDNELLVNPVHVIDLAFALPGLIIGSVLLWKGRSLGYIIASIALVFMVLLTIALAAMVIMLVAREISEDFTVAIVFGVLSIASLLFAILLLRCVKA